MSRLTGTLVHTQCISCVSFHASFVRSILGRKANDALTSTLSTKATEVTVLPVRDEALDSKGLMLDARPAAAGTQMDGGLRTRSGSNSSSWRRGRRRQLVRNDAPAGAGGAKDGHGIAVEIVLVFEATAEAAGAGVGHDPRGGRCGSVDVVASQLER